MTKFLRLLTFGRNERNAREALLLLEKGNNNLDTWVVYIEVDLATSFNFGWNSALNLNIAKVFRKVKRRDFVLLRD